MRLPVLSAMLLALLLLGLTPPSLATNYVVTNLDDDGPGSLRLAIAFANTSPTNDSIIFDTTINGTINLRSPLRVRDNGTLTLTGNGLVNTIISGDTDNNGTGDVQVLLVDFLANLTINQLQLTRGYAPNDGGGIYNEGTLTMNNSTVSHSSATYTGGGIYNNGTLTIDTSTISNNIASTGGGIFNNSGTLMVNHSTISSNTASTGGGIFNNSGAITLNNSIISDNSATYNSGGIYNHGVLTINNSTISGNSAANSGGGIYNHSGTLTLNNSIIANSTRGGDCYRLNDTINVYHSLIEEGLSCVNGTNSNNLTGDPMLNADLTLQAGSPAIDTGNNSLILSDITTDLAGNARIQNTTVDMGAFESAPYVPPEVTLTPATINITEGGSNDLTISRSGSTASALTVNLTITLGTDTTTGDYTLSGGSISAQSGSATVTIPAGSSSVTVTLSTTNDAIDESNETLTIALVDDVSYDLGLPSSTTATIADNDTAGITVSPTSGLTTSEAGATATFTVVLTSQPTADVLIALSSSNTSEGTVSPASLTFTSANWNSVQNVTVTGVDDVLVDGAIGYSIVLATATSSDAHYNGFNPADVSVTNTDNDTAGITVTPTSGLTTTEAGVTATFTVVLNSQPTADVVIDLSSNDTSEGTVSPASLTFTNANWNSAQTVTVTGVDDAVDDGNVSYNIVLAAATSSDANYNGFDPADVSVTNSDNDTAGITVTPTSGLTTSEAGATATFTVVLNSQPTADVVIALSSNDTSEGTVSPASLTFTSANWNSAQTVTVTGVDDAVVDGNVGYSIVLAAATSSDAHYNGFDPTDVSVTNTDNDTAGITVTPTSGLTTSEAGGTTSFTVVLNSQPTADVLIALSSSNTNEGTVSPASLTFTSANWNSAQTVTVTGVDDALVDGTVGYTIVLTAATSGDASYNGVNPTDVSVTNTDNDTAGITVTPTSGLTTSEAGATASFTVVLNSQPTADVVIALSSNDTSEGTVSPASLTFTNANWNTPQTVTVTGVDDAMIDGAIGYSIVLAAATSGDASYNGFDPTDVSVTNTDNDTAGITVTPTSGLTTSEAGATATFTVKLNSQPTANVSIALSSNDTSEGTVSPASLTFTNANWNTAQTVTLTGVDDALVDGTIGYSIVLAAATSSDAHYSGFDPADVSVTNTDNDTAGITVTPTSGLTTSEAGGTTSFTVRLNSQPTANVSIALSSNDTSEGTVSPASLTFTSANWSTPQTVTVTGVDDAVIDGTIGYTIVLAAATSGDASYNGFDPTDVSVTNSDNDTAGITVTPTSGLTTTEAGGTTSFTVVLTSQPTADVLIALSSSNTTEGTVSPASLTFTSANWNSAQTVTVTGVDDAVDDGNVSYNIVLAAATSSDANYNGVNPTDVSVSNTDNDTAGITVTPTSGLTTTEAGATATFTVVLTSQPTADVLINLSSSNTSEGTVSPASLTFTSANWNSAQTVTVTGVDDAVDDGNVSYTIVLAAATSSDANYNGVNPTDVSVSNTDNDTAGITVTPTSGLTTTEAGATATFTVVLTSQPTADVLINLSSSNTSEGTVSPASLTFTSANWNSAQTVTVTGVDDAVDDGDIGYSITLTVDANSDATYAALTPSSVSVTNTDNDSATSIPTLSEWALLLLATLMLRIGMHTVTQRRM